MGSARRLIRARFLLACDGGSSAVRKELGVDFAGISYEEKWVDVQARLKRPMHVPPHFEFISNPTRPGVKCPCPAGMYRWEWRVNPEDGIGDTLDQDRAWEMLADYGVTPDDVEITRTWAYTFHVRKCTRWRVGRVLMVGDAAHVMPPFAGQGISGAFRDAANVVWKTAAVLRGQADGALLDSYQAEREPHHDAMTASAVRIGKLVMVRNRKLARARDVFFRLVTKLPGVQTTLSRKITEPAGLVRGYLNASPSTSKKSPVGQLIKAVTVAAPGVRLVHIDEALGTGWSILGLDADPRVEMAPTAVCAWSAYQPRYFTVRPGTSVVEDGELGDPVGQLWDWMTKWGVRFLIVRPDRYVYAAAAEAVDLPKPALTQVSAPQRAGRE
jgi:3-(3-hydroxy-phenyl)propionate hydroxylase